MTSQRTELYDSEMRRNPPAEPGQRIEYIGGIVRSRGSYNVIIFSELAVAAVDRRVAEQARFFTQLGEEVEWKVYAHDAPSNLSAALAVHGFVPGESETLMMRKLGAEELPVEAAADVDVRTVSDLQQLDTYFEVTASAFGKRAQSSMAGLAARLFDDDADTIASIAYIDDIAVAAGRVELPHGRSFASLWGGGTHPFFRRRGVYRTLVAERLRLARDKGYTYVTVDARETSRPILERLGFLAESSIVAWVLPGASQIR